MKKMKKLYYATLDVMFVSDEMPTDKTTSSFLMEKLDCYYPSATEITCIDQVPNVWKNALLWGTPHDITVEQFLTAQRKENDPEYTDYLRLKAKFEK